MTVKVDYGAISDETLLEQALATYVSGTTPYDPNLHIIGATGDSELFEVVLIEIWLTLLPRRLVFQTGGGNRLDVEVADRHVLKVVAASGQYANNGLDDALTPLVQSSETGIAALSALITRFCQAGGPVSVTHLRRSGLARGVTGIGVHAIRRFGPIAPLPRSDLLERFIALLGSIPIGLIISSNTGDEQRFGDIETLVDLRSDLLSEDETGHVIGDQLVILAGGESVGDNICALGVAIARVDRSQLLLSFDADNTLRVGNLWVTATHQK